MTATPLSLLERLKVAKPDASDWQRLQEIYPPLIRSWLARVPGVRDEIDDLTQEVLVVLFREMSSFERRRDGSFRAWLRQVTVNRVRAFQKARQRRPIAGLGEAADQLLAQLEDSDSNLARSGTGITTRMFSKNSLPWFAAISSQIPGKHSSDSQ